MLWSISSANASHALNPEIPREREIAVFLEWCAESHVDAPEELEALLIQDREFRQSGLL